MVCSVGGVLELCSRWVLDLRGHVACRIDHIRACHNVLVVIDLHCHVLPGIDDGPATIDGSLALARAAAAAGTRVLVATPHVNWRYRNDPQEIAALVAELGERLAYDGVLSATGEVLEVRAGAEVALTQAAGLAPAQLAKLGLGGGRWLLVEPPFTPVATNIDGLLLELQGSGCDIVLAHPERCPAFQRNPEMLRELVGAGMLTSVTAGSFAGHFGTEARRLALALARDGLLHNVASDAHDDVKRPPRVLDDLAQAGLAPLGKWLTVAVPAAILDGAPIPARPAVALPDIERQRRWLPPRR
jgi:protein-tyrosine phosphatase